MARTMSAGSPSGSYGRTARFLVHVGARWVHQHASAVRYARKGQVSVLPGRTGGGPTVISDVNWRIWPADREAVLDQIEALVMPLYRRAVFQGDTDTRDDLLPFITTLNRRRRADGSPGC